MAASRTKFLCWETPGTGAHVIVELNWDKAPKTCEALLERCFPTQRTDLTTVHGRHSGMEALFITPGEPIRNVGDENETTDFVVGDVLFCYEPKGCCSHGDVDRSEVAWIYGAACQPSRWVSKNGDPTNQTPPFRRVTPPLNVWGKVVSEEGFYSTCLNLLTTGEQALVVTRLEGSTLEEAKAYRQKVGAARLPAMPPTALAVPLLVAIPLLVCSWLKYKGRL